MSEFRYYLNVSIQILSSFLTWEKNNLPVLNSAKSNIHKKIFNKLKKSTERRKADLMLHDTGELQW
tara:strand:+ start:736 stop:933 length:198 start_codon:yes stop_codon:yes gene_type:complete